MGQGWSSLLLERVQFALTSSSKESQILAAIQCQDLGRGAGLGFLSHMSMILTRIHQLLADSEARKRVLKLRNANLNFCQGLSGISQVQGFTLCPFGHRQSHFETEQNSKESLSLTIPPGFGVRLFQTQWCLNTTPPLKKFSAL